MLIKGGKIHTMTKQGTIVGDILVQDGRVAAVGESIDAPGEPCILDAKGMHVLPGLIDVHIHDSPEADRALLCGPQPSGVTTGLIWPENEGLGRIITADKIEASNLFIIRPENFTDVQLHDKFISLAENGMKIACEITGELNCRRILQAVHSTRVKAILSGLNACEEMVEAIALSGCPAIIGISEQRTCSPWTMASRLDALGVRLAVTCSYPQAKLANLPLCAALCVREGMERERALLTVTTAPAALLGRSEIGRIASGCQADFAIYDGDPLLCATSHVMTIAGGKIRH